MHKLKTIRKIVNILIINQVVGHTAGYMVQENSGQHGQAFAGRGVVSDASSLFWNPAIAGLLKNHELAGGINYLNINSRFSPNNNTAAVLQSSGYNRNKSHHHTVPALYGVYKLNDRIRFGLAVTSPFGLMTKYDDNWTGRYIATKTQINTVNLNPSMTYKMNPNLAIAGGIVFQDFHADLRNSLNQRLLGLIDGHIKFKVKGWGYGYNLGLIYNLSRSTKVGLAYRSAVHHKLKGNINVDNISPALTNPASLVYQPKLKNGPIQVKVKTPAIYDLSFSHDLNNTWTLLGDIMYTRWKTFKNLSVNHVGAGIKDAFVEHQSWRSSFMYSLGFNYKYNDQWLMRFGGAYETTPTRDIYRTPRLPDGNRIWTSGGVDYSIDDRNVVRLSYTHLFVKKANINAADLTTRPQRVSGQFKTHINIIGLHYNYRF